MLLIRLCPEDCGYCSQSIISGSHPVRKDTRGDRGTEPIRFRPAFVFLRHEASRNGDPLHELRTQLKDYFFQQDEAYQLPGGETAVSIATFTDLDKASLREKRLFLAEFSVTFKGTRPR